MHKAAQLIEAVAAAVRGLPTTGDNVQTMRFYPFAEFPAITVRLSDIEPIIEVSNAVLDSWVDIETIYHVAGSDFDLDSQVLQIDAEVYAAIMADRTFGGVATDTDPQSLTVDATAEGERPTASGVRRWRCRIRHSITDTEA